jgi:predicted DNA binding CopG/RHH family protein
MSRKKMKPIPKFRSEAEERAFWEAKGNDSTDYVDWSKAQHVDFRNLRPTTKAISLRLPEPLLNRIRAEAVRLDVPYQSLMKVWLAERVERVQKPGKPAK